jgi:8-oxo-dGTP pyrophosphatase MutT (NUDIX family)
LSLEKEWVFKTFGGSLQLQESVKDALFREVLEELNCKPVSHQELDKFSTLKWKVHHIYSLELNWDIEIPKECAIRWIWYYPLESHWKEVNEIRKKLAPHIHKYTKRALEILLSHEWRENLPHSKFTIDHDKYWKGFDNILKFWHPDGKQPIEEISE